MRVTTVLMLPVCRDRTEHCDHYECHSCDHLTEHSTRAAQLSIPHLTGSMRSRDCFVSVVVTVTVNITSFTNVSMNDAVRVNIICPCVFRAYLICPCMNSATF